ncbi:MAG TPA: universal stress protein [Micromonosporaceae bacterium]
MRTVLAALDDTPAAVPVLASARTLATTLGARLVAMHVQTDGVDTPLDLAAAADVPLRIVRGDVVEQLIAGDHNPDVVATVIGARALRRDPRPLGTTAVAVATRTSKPMLVVPPEARLHPRFNRVLVPLEGSVVSSAAPQVLIELAPDVALDIVALHVLGRDTIPAFTDQPQHEQAAWTREFLARYCPWGLDLVHLETRVGHIDELVAEVASEYDCDMVVLGWLQDLTPGRASVVRATLARSTVPIFLIRLPAEPLAAEPDAAERDGAERDGAERGAAERGAAEPDAFPLDAAAPDVIASEGYVAADERSTRGATTEDAYRRAARETGEE